MPAEWSADDLAGVPDLLAPVRLYRYWRHSRLGGRAICSIVSGLPWMAAEIAARCLPGAWGPRLPHPHFAPHRDCDCGLYGYFLPDTASLTHSFGAPGTVFGVVEVAGRAIIHPLGLRAERMRIVALACPSVSDDCRPAAYGQHYGVPVYGRSEELVAAYPPQDVSAWLGESATAARQQYLEKPHHMRLSRVA